MEREIPTNSIPVITIDGPSGSGKGTISRLVAGRLGWNFLDSGALYRLVALAALHHAVALDDEDLVFVRVAAVAAAPAGRDLDVPQLEVQRPDFAREQPVNPVARFRDAHCLPVVYIGHIHVANSRAKRADYTTSGSAAGTATASSRLPLL